jgi:hypothetical protein
MNMSEHWSRTLKDKEIEAKQETDTGYFDPYHPSCIFPFDKNWNLKPKTS